MALRSCSADVGKLADATGRKTVFRAATDGCGPSDRVHSSGRMRLVRAEQDRRARQHMPRKARRRRLLHHGLVSRQLQRRRRVADAGPTGRGVQPLAASRARPADHAAGGGLQPGGGHRGGKRKPARRSRLRRTESLQLRLGRRPQADRLVPLAAPAGGLAAVNPPAGDLRRSNVGRRDIRLGTWVVCAALDPAQGRDLAPDGSVPGMDRRAVHSASWRVYERSDIGSRSIFRSITTPRRRSGTRTVLPPPCGRRGAT